MDGRNSGRKDEWERMDLYLTPYFQDEHKHEGASTRLEITVQNLSPKEKCVYHFEFS